MSEGKFESWEEIIIDFFESKKNAEEITYLKGEIIKVKSIKGESSDLKEILNEKKPSEKTEIDFIRQKALNIIKYRFINPDVDRKLLIENYRKKLQTLTDKYTARNWINNNYKNAINVSFATHVIKLTHSSIESVSLIDCIMSNKNAYLSTSTLKNKPIDGAVSGNQFAPVFQFLELQLNSIKLSTEFQNINNTVLTIFSKDNDELSLWNKSLQKAVIPKDKSTHSLAKQVYFPTFKFNQDYHLLCNIKSSSLAHRLFENNQRLKLDKKKQKAYNNSKFSNELICKYPRKATLAITASNHGNASQLNGKRGGELLLFPSSPPIWKSQLKPPIYKQSFFYACHNNNIDESFQYISEFLMRFEGLKSIQETKLKRHLIRWVRNIADDIIFYANTIQNLPHGWSDIETIKLKKEHQYYLDPFRTDDAFISEKESTHWQKIVCRDFAQWMAYKLHKKNNKYTAQTLHKKIWTETFEPMLRDDVDTLKHSMSYQALKEQA